MLIFSISYLNELYALTIKTTTYKLERGHIHCQMNAQANHETEK